MFKQWLGNAVSFPGGIATVLYFQVCAQEGLRNGDARRWPSGVREQASMVNAGNGKMYRGERSHTTTWRATARGTWCHEYRAPRQTKDYWLGKASFPRTSLRSPRGGQPREITSPGCTGASSRAYSLTLLSISAQAPFLSVEGLSLRAQDYGKA